jgi:hypothetical protein
VGHTIRSVHRCTDCDHFLELQYLEGDGLRLGECDRCGAQQRSEKRRSDEFPAELVSEALPDGRIVVAGPDGGWIVTFRDSDSDGTHYQSEVLLSEVDRPPLPENGYGYISWVGEDLLIVDQDPANRTHSAALIDGSLDEVVPDLEDAADVMNHEAVREYLARHLYRAAYGEAKQSI